MSMAEYLNMSIVPAIISLTPKPIFRTGTKTVAQVNSIPGSIARTSGSSNTIMIGETLLCASLNVDAPETSIIINPERNKESGINNNNIKVID